MKTTQRGFGQRGRQAADDLCADALRPSGRACFEAVSEGGPGAVWVAGAGTGRSALRGALLLLVLLAAGSCRKAAERVARKIRIEAIERIDRQGLSGAELVVRMTNDTRHRLVLERAAFDLYYDSVRVSRIRLRHPVEVPRRFAGSITTLWRTRDDDPMALYVLDKRLREGNLSQVAVSFEIEGRGGPVPVNISRRMVPLSEFLNIFGLTLEDITNYLEE